MRRSALLAGLSIVAFVCWIHWAQIRNEFFVLLGSRNETGGWYGFHSGAGGAAWMSLLVFLTGFWWHHQCGVHRCYWYARRTTAAGERACFLHHPSPRRTLADLHEAHHEARKKL